MRSYPRTGSACELIKVILRLTAAAKINRRFINRPYDRFWPNPQIFLHHLQPFRHTGLNNGAAGQHDDKVHLVHRSLDRVRKGNEPKRDRLVAKFLSLQCADLDTVKGGHKVSRDLSYFLFGDGLRDILLIGFEDVLQCATGSCRTSTKVAGRSEKCGIQKSVPHVDLLGSYIPEFQPPKACGINRPAIYRAGRYAIRTSG